MEENLKRRKKRRHAKQPEMPRKCEDLILLTVELSTVLNPQ